MTTEYRGWRIVQEGSLFALPDLRWGPAPHEYHRFKSLRAAKDFIDRRARQAQEG